MNKLLIFAKSPIKGKVKTRLKKDTTLTDDDILKLYTAFLKDTIVAASLSKAQRIYIAYYPEDSREVMIRICHHPELDSGYQQIEMFPQSGKGFDARITNAIRHISLHPPYSTPFDKLRGRGKKGGDNIIILGSDSPHIQPTTINRAFGFLSNPKSRGAMVLGPSGEGGVYLIGVKGQGSRVRRGFDFNGVFTTGNESDNLLSIARRKKLPLLILEELTDVDVKSDLITLVSNLSMIKYSSNYTNIHLPRYTLKAIKELGLCVKRKGDGSTDSPGGGTREKYLFKRELAADLHRP
ncbi:MAG: DUF2064 domain-containing protein [Nitrospinae bacterium]|nr:DUF2064 domain-containing protein [Nitrospinota bacterium]MBI3814396.1 DUF2064 domain-containing protein [Nitrospinota bacterium]